MKTSLILLAGLIIGLAAGIFLNPVYSGNTSIKQRVKFADTKNPPSSNENVGSLPALATGITLKNAWKMFDDYHGVSHNNSHVCMTTTVYEGQVAKQKNIESIYLPYTGFLEVIKTRVENENEIFLGLAGIPAYNSNPDTLSHTMIWVPVIEGKNNRPQYYIPQQNSSEFIFEYVGICPEDCPENRCDIWKKDWDTSAACTVNF